MFSRATPKLLTLVAVCLVAASVLSCSLLRTSAPSDQALLLYLEEGQGKTPSITVANVAQLLDFYVKQLQQCSVTRPQLCLDRFNSRIPPEVAPRLDRAWLRIKCEVWPDDESPDKGKIQERFVERLWEIFPEVEHWSHRAVLINLFEAIGREMVHVEEGRGGSFPVRKVNPRGKERLSRIYQKIYPSITSTYVKAVMTAMFAQVAGDEECLDRCELMLWSENNTEVILGIAGLFCKEGHQRLVRNGRRLLKHPDYWVRLCAANVLFLFGAKEAIYPLLDACKTAIFPMLSAEDPLAIMLIWGEESVDIPAWELAHITLLNWFNLRQADCPHRPCVLRNWEDPVGKVNQDGACDYPEHLANITVLEKWFKDNWNTLVASNGWFSLEDFDPAEKPPSSPPDH